MARLHTRSSLSSYNYLLNGDNLPKTRLPLLIGDIRAGRTKQAYIRDISLLARLDQLRGDVDLVLVRGRDGS
jgi:hypothetical protein